MRHVLVMTGASSVGLIAMFTVDVVDMFFITMLGEQRLVAAVGFAGTLLYFLLSLGIGLQIALGALVARAEGNQDRALAGRYCSSVLWFNALTVGLVAAIAWVWLPELLALLGASGDTLNYALAYSRIQLPAVPLLVLGMSLAAGLRAVGDARRSMYATLAGAGANAVLDPILIFYFGLGIEGAAWASVASRVVVVSYAAYVLFLKHRLPTRVSPAMIVADAPAIMLIAVPAVLTNLATPLGNSLLLRMMSQFGDSAVAASAVMGRLAPLAFAVVFAVSGAVGPIVGQNAGACRYDRVRQTLIDASKFVVLYVAVAWVLLWLVSDLVIAAFTASELAADLLAFYIHFLVGAFAFNGLLFVANASFNNLGRAYLATLFNYAKVFLGVVPAAYLGASLYGARGLMVGEVLGASLFGVLGMLSALALVARLERDYPPLPPVNP
ncbi:putative efflux protein, MATE family [Congregibacter litoralis KT71]|uniref:Multidrug-efflux transporter n=2 Tax=Congregibacter TaxID=393661 RepID=A4A9P9_9GAMM|nr:putative efflux protein, MATE family [Congregibacter litoralis KT71]